MIKSDMKMPDEAARDFAELHEQVEKYLEFINESVREENADILAKATSWGNKITRHMKEYRSSHLERVEAGQTSALQSLIITDILNSYRRVKDHALNIAEVLAGEK